MTLLVQSDEGGVRVTRSASAVTSRTRTVSIHQNGFTALH